MLGLGVFSLCYVYHVQSLLLICHYCALNWCSFPHREILSQIVGDIKLEEQDAQKLHGTTRSASVA